MPTNRITERKKRNIKNMLAEGYHPLEIARELSVSLSTIDKIRLKEKNNV